MKYRFNRRPSRRRPLLSMGVIILVGVGAAFLLITWFIRHQYENSLQPVSDSTKIVYFTVEKGTSAKQIGKNLQNAKLIRSSKAFEWYIRDQEVRDKLIAGTYTLDPAMSTKEIVDKMVKGDIARNLFTILPGKRLPDQLNKQFLEAGFSQQQINEALKPANYPNSPALIYLPKTATLEGFLYPDSYDKADDTPLSTIVTASLAEMNKHLTPDIKAGCANQKLSIYQCVTLASIVEQEVANINDRPIVAQVFLSRLRQGIPLGSDVTAYYAGVLAGKPGSLTVDSPYNTHTAKGLPPGPIGTISSTSLEAVANPANTDYLFFVSGDDGVTHFTHTQAEHEAAVAKYCHELCQ